MYSNIYVWCSIWCISWAYWYRDVLLTKTLHPNRILSWTYLVPRYTTRVETCKLMCFLPDTDSISPNIWENVGRETVKTVKYKKIRRWTPKTPTQEDFLDVLRSYLRVSGDIQFFGVNLTILWSITRKILRPNLNKYGTVMFDVVSTWVSPEYKRPEWNTGQQRVLWWFRISHPRGS